MPSETPDALVSQVYDVLGECLFADSPLGLTIKLGKLDVVKREVQLHLDMLTNVVSLFSF